MSTIKQQQATRKVMEEGKSVSKAMVEAGYTPRTAKTPANLTDSAGFEELMEKYGLTKELIASSLVEDIQAKKKRRVAELGLGAKILGMENKGQGEEAQRPTPILALIQNNVPRNDSPQEDPKPD